MANRLRLIVSAAALCALAACSSSSRTPAQVEMRGAAARDSGAAASSASGVHVVRRGENLYRIALAHGMSVQEIASLNRLNAPYTIYPGQELRVRGAAPAPARTASRDTGGAITPPSRLTEPGRDIAPPPARVETASPPPPPPPPPPARPVDAPSFAWPHRGEVLAGFGPQEGGRRSDGVKIAARVGDPVNAAADGEVVYAGNELQGYGELVLIRHEGGWVTAYAHNSVLRVSVGQQVRQGEMVAEAGSTGAADRPQLHFEIRRGVTPVDPALHLPRR